VIIQSVLARIITDIERVIEQKRNKRQKYSFKEIRDACICNHMSSRDHSFNEYKRRLSQIFGQRGAAVKKFKKKNQRQTRLW
jgi:hypothetical protein